MSHLEKANPCAERVGYKNSLPPCYTDKEKKSLALVTRGIREHPEHPPRLYSHPIFYARSQLPVPVSAFLKKQRPKLITAVVIPTLSKTLLS